MNAIKLMEWMFVILVVQIRIYGSLSDSIFSFWEGGDSFLYIYIYIYRKVYILVQIYWPYGSAPNLMKRRDNWLNSGSCKSYIFTTKD